MTTRPKSTRPKSTRPKYTRPKTTRPYQSDSASLIQRKIIRIRPQHSAMSLGHLTRPRSSSFGRTFTRPHHSDSASTRPRTNLLGCTFIRPHLHSAETIRIRQALGQGQIHSAATLGFGQVYSAEVHSARMIRPAHSDSHYDSASSFGQPFGQQDDSARMIRTASGTRPE